MKLAKIKFLLIQIDEAHSTAWPVGLDNTPTPQTSFQERVDRANEFVLSEPTLLLDSESFIVKIDGWDNIFAETFHAWPDKYYLIDNSYKVIKKSEYGSKGEQDAHIKIDCTKLICNLINKK